MDRDHRRLRLGEQRLDVEPARTLKPAARLARHVAVAVVVEGQEEQPGDQRGDDRAAEGDQRQHLAAIAIRRRHRPRVGGQWGQDAT